MKRGIYYFLKLIARLLPRWKDAESLKVLPPQPDCKLTLPVNLYSFPKKFAENFPQTVSIPERRVFILENVNVLGTGIIFKNMRIFLPSLSWMEDLKLFSQGHVLIKQWINKIPKKKEPVALVYDYWASLNYYHWMIDSLPKLLVLQKTFPDCPLIVPEKLPEYIKTTTRIFGFNKLLPLKNYNSFKVTNLIFPEQTAPIGFQDPLLIKEVSAVIKKHFSISLKKEKYVYVSRTRQKIRQLINEKDLLEVLRKYGFETIFFEELSLEEQANLISNVSIIIGVNGSNLVNILFMAPGSTVIELMNKKVNNSCTYSLASALSLSYFCIPCDPADPGINTTDHVENNSCNIYIEVARLEETLQFAFKNNLQKEPGIKS